MGRKRKYNTDDERKEAKKIINNRWRELHPEKAKETINAASKKWGRSNKNKIKEYNKSFNKNNPEYQKEYRKVNINEIKTKRNKREKERKLVDPLYKLSHDIRRSVRQSFKRNNFTKLSKTNVILGCSFGFFKNYLESKFESWMNWENRGKYNGTFNFGWDIDHIIPLSSAKTEEDIVRLNHYSNLQPLCSKINRDIKKGY